jgi:hypothetical protein
MAAFVASTSAAMLNWLSGNATPAAAATRYIAPYNGDPQGAGTDQMTALTGAATRPSLTAAVPSTATATATSNLDITFTAAASGAATVNFVAIMTAATAGTVMASAAVTSKTVSAGDSLKILSGNLTITIA